jgi:phospholipase A1/A2
MTLGSAIPALAAPVDADNLGECTKIDNRDKRLDCYDRLAGRVSTAAPVATPAATPATASPAVSSAPSSTVASATSSETKSLLTEAWDLDNSRERFEIRPYKPVYFLPVFHTDRINAVPHSPTRGYGDNNGTPRKTEAKFQISFKTKIAHDIFGNNGDLWGAYTQSSRWQVYNGASSRPFRETNYEPEAMFVWRTKFDAFGLMTGRYLSIGINHQSNGQSDPLSRSWNRITGAIGLERDRWTLTVRPWWRLPEHGSNDDNPDLADYAGRGELLLTYADNGYVFSADARHSLRGGNRNHGSLRFDLAIPIPGHKQSDDQNQGLRLHLQWFTGYAESLIDYNHRANYLGLGVSLKEWH